MKLEADLGWFYFTAAKDCLNYANDWLQAKIANDPEFCKSVREKAMKFFESAAALASKTRQFEFSKRLLRAIDEISKEKGLGIKVELPKDPIEPFLNQLDDITKEYRKIFLKSVGDDLEKNRAHYIEAFKFSMSNISLETSYEISARLGSVQSFSNLQKEWKGTPEELESIRESCRQVFLERIEEIKCERVSHEKENKLAFEKIMETPQDPSGWRGQDKAFMNRIFGQLSRNYEALCKLGGKTLAFDQHEHEKWRQKLEQIKD